MKDVFLLIIALLSIDCYSQAFDSTADKVIFLKDGTRIIPKQSDVRNHSEDDEIIYWNEGSSREKYIKYKDLDYIKLGDKIFKTFELKEKGETRKQKPHPRFIVIETPKYKLITAYYPSSLGAQMVIVVDNEDVVLESKLCILKTTKKDIKSRNEAVEIIKKYFSDLKEEMDFLEQCTANDGKDSFGLKDFLDKHTYKKYN